MSLSLDSTGTSMATPAAAGASLLVRQYFTSTTKAFWLGTFIVCYDSMM